MPAGRPRKYNSPEDMDKAIEAYFQEDRNHTICGLALALGFLDRHSLDNYGDYSKEYFTIIKKAKLRVQDEYEQDLRAKGIKPTGPIFALKQMGWKDKHEIEGGMKLEIVIKN